MAALSGDTVRDTEQKTVISFATGSYVVHFHAPATFVSIERPHPLPPLKKTPAIRLRGAFIWINVTYKLIFLQLRIMFLKKHSHDSTVSELCQTQNG